MAKTTDEIIDSMSVPEIVVHVSALFISNGCDPSEVPSTGEENYVAFRKLLKCLIKVLPKRELNLIQTKVAEK